MRKTRFHHLFKLRFYGVIFAGVIALVILALSDQVTAQTTDSSWSAPVNLSNSGGTTRPQMVVDANGKTHVLWQDAIVGFVYRQGIGGTWSSPASVGVPFDARQYEEEYTGGIADALFDSVLLSDRENRIHATWVEGNAVYYSNVPADSFAAFTTWSPRTLIAEIALDVDLAVDDTGGLHLVYVNPSDNDLFPAGVYYRQSTDRGATWSNPLLLYASPYLRTLDVGLAHVDVAVLDSNQILATWDNSPLERVFAIRSGNGGRTWDSLIEVDKRQESDGTGSIGPNRIMAAANGEAFHLIWQAGHEGRSCALYHRISLDGGITWQQRRKVLETAEGCLVIGQFIRDPNGLLIVIGETEMGMYVSAWNGTQWSEPRLQTPLIGFTNPETFRQVDFGCLQTAIGGTGAEDSPLSLIVVGCDNGAGDDIWLRERSWSGLTEQIAPLATPVWKRLEVVNSAVQIDSPVLVADADGWLHTFWRQQEDGTNAAYTIHYSRWDGTGWTPARSVLASKSGQNTAHFDAILGPDSTLLVSWSSGSPGQLFFSQATTARAGTTSDWSSPSALPMVRPAASSPSIAVDRAGVIYIAYALPLNEGRGIYTTQSGDRGATWLEPVHVFDAAAAGWEVADKPHLAITSDDTLHLMWRQFSAPPDANPLTVSYSRSTDGGATWSDAVEVSDNPVSWVRLLAIGERTVHRIWQDISSGIWHQLSTDSGLTWSLSQRISGVGTSFGPADLTSDGAGRPVFVQATGLAANNSVDTAIHSPQVQHWTWIGDRWVPGENLSLETNTADELSARVAAGANLSVIYTGPTTNLGSGEQQIAILFSRRVLDLPELAPTPLPPLTPTPVAVATILSTPTPMPSPTIEFPTEADDSGVFGLDIDTSNPLTGPLLGIIPAALVVVVAFFIGMRLMRGGRK